MRYTKQFQGVSQQIEILRSRGLLISDEARATAYLTRIGYYRLSGYAFPLKKAEYRRDERGIVRTDVLDAFREGAEFRHVVDLYVFDKKLRLLMLDAIERVEVGIRTSIAMTMGPRGPWAHRDRAELDGVFSKRPDKRTRRIPHDDWLNGIDTAFARSTDEFAKHFRDKYRHDHPPIWISSEVWDFGTLSRFYAGMKFNDRKEIAADYGVGDQEIMTSWLKSINYVRNICAHHSRLWNKPLVIQCKFPPVGSLPALDHVLGDELRTKRIYSAASAIRFLLLKINPGTTWPLRLKALLDEFPTAPGVELAQTGFFAGWEEEALWRVPQRTD